MKEPITVEFKDYYFLVAGLKLAIDFLTKVTSLDKENIMFSLCCVSEESFRHLTNEQKQELMVSFQEEENNE